MRPFASPDGHDTPRLIDEAVPGEAAMVEDVLVGLEDPVREPVIAHELPDVFDGIELGAFRRQRDERDVRRHDERVGAVPSSLIQEQNGVGTGRHRGRDLGEMERHPLGVAAG
jgi:hypothetical protein